MRNNISNGDYDAESNNNCDIDSQKVNDHNHSNNKCCNSTSTGLKDTYITTRKGISTAATVCLVLIRAG